MAEQEDQVPGRSAIAELFGSEAELAALAGDLSRPVYWPAVPAEQLAEELDALRAWVERLVERFSLDSHAVPGCWWRHNHLREALAALRDHERGSYAATSPPTAAVDFHRALSDIEGRLRSWVAELRCDASHHRSHDSARRLEAEGWEEWLAAEMLRRRPGPALNCSTAESEVQNTEKSPPRPH